MKKPTPNHIVDVFCWVCRARGLLALPLEDTESNANKCNRRYSKRMVGSLRCSKCETISFVQIFNGVTYYVD